MTSVQGGWAKTRTRQGHRQSGKFEQLILLLSGRTPSKSLERQTDFASGMVSQRAALNPGRIHQATRFRDRRGRWTRRH